MLVSQRAAFFQRHNSFKTQVSSELCKLEATELTQVTKTELEVIARARTLHHRNAHFVRVGSYLQLSQSMKNTLSTFDGLSNHKGKV